MTRLLRTADHANFALPSRATLRVSPPGMRVIVDRAIPHLPQ